MLFGHQNDDNQPADDSQAPTVTAANPLAVNLANSASLPVIPEELEQSEAVVAPSLDQPTAPTAPAVTPSNPDSDVLTPSRNDELLRLKQQALEQLSPLVGHLEQSPEEKFRTTMMMIQSSDNQALIKDAYAAAQQIGDDKTRAQALLDIVNEINYFTQQSQTS